MTPTTIAKTERIATLHALAPSAGAFVRGLLSLFNEESSAPVTLLERRPNGAVSTFPSEIVTCRLDDGRELCALCKYGRGRSHTSHGHRGDVSYEAEVYRHVVQPLRLSAPRFFGSYDASPSETWLAIEFVDEALRVSAAKPLPQVMRLAARWIAQFHLASRSRLDPVATSFLISYDARYYRQWTQRTLALTSRLPDPIPWLRPLCKRFDRCVDLLLARRTVIHGEYSPKNILLSGSRICPVDWESAAVAAGEIDLASLIDGKWRPAIVEECIREYALIRWPEGSPPDFALALGLARLYWNFRWLGERVDWTTGKKGRKRLEYLRAIADDMGWL